MSLQVWLPLNGNINNQGLSEITPSGTPKYYTNGKMSSKCLDMSSAITATASGLTGATEWSAAFWYKIDNNDSLSTDWIDVLWLQDETADNSTIGGFRFETCYSSSKIGTNAEGLHWHDNSTNATVDDWAYVSYDREIWHHACITVSPTKGIHTYCDGIVVHTSSKTHGGGHLTGYFRIGETNKISGGIQDVRLYDHCLSAKEVAEIAKGLILHYKLDHNGAGGANLINNSGPTVNTIWSISTNWTGSIVECPTAPLGMCVRTTANKDTVGGGMHRAPWARDNFVDGEKYTISAYIRSNVNGLKINFKNEMMPNNVIILSTEWKHYSYTSTIDISAKWYSDIFYASDTSQVTTGTYIEVHSLKLEKGSRSTPWIPSSADSLYTEMGFDTTEEPDCSGFGNNGTMIGTYTYDSDTPRYSLSTVFNGTDNYINTNLPESVLGNNWTISFWSYATQRPTGSAIMGVVGLHSSLSGSNYTGMVIMQLNASTTMIGLGNGSNWNTYYFTKTIEVGKWYHVVVTYDNSSAKYYLDGVLDGSQTRNFVPYSNIVIGQTHTNGNRFWNGKVSDFRVYTTTLTPDQVKELYNTSCSIDNNGNLFCYQIEERLKTSISKYGIWSDKYFSKSIISQYDPLTYVEPDGSVWIRIFHHNDPANNGIFSITDTFATSVYIDDNRWFNVSVCNRLSSKWELMIKQKLLDTDDETKYRWIQNYNPMTATYEQVVADNVTKVTTAGYSSHDLHGGLHKHSASTYICASYTARPSDWWCAVGSYRVHNGGIPGYAGTTITTGYMDLYLRVDNIDTPNFRINAGGTMATDFYEM